MNMFKSFSRAAAMFVLLAFAAQAQADELQDANKLFKQGRHAQAMEKVDAILASKPKDAQARFLKGLIFAEQGDTSEAIKTFTGLTEDYPELPEPYNNLAVLYAGQGQYEKAKNALEMAIRTHPSYATAHENLGDIYAKMASQAYDRALQLDKGNTSTKTKLALIRELFSKSAHTTRKPAATAAMVEPAAVAAPAPVPVAAPAPVVAAAPPPAATKPAPEPVVAAAVPAADPAAEVLKATREWAAAWSAKDSKKYLAFYASDFATPGGMSRDAWKAQRKARIAAPKSIHVEVHDANVKVSDSAHASISFRQTYRASHLNSTSRKTLEWVKVDGRWMIAQEQSGR